MELIGLYLVAAGLLLVAGFAKAVRPDDTARALGDLVRVQARSVVNFGRMRSLVRAGAVLELVLGLLAIALPRPLTAGLVATSYAAFGWVVVYARSKGGALSSCGCFGKADTPATALHALVDILLAGACVTVALDASSDGSLLTLLAPQPGGGLPLVFLSAVGLFMAYLVLAKLPTLEGAARLVRPVPEPSTEVRSQ